MLTDERDDDTSTLRLLRQKLKEANAEAKGRREELETLRDAAIRGLAHDAGVTDPRHLAAVARLHPEDAEVSPASVRSTVKAYPGLFGGLPSGDGDDDDA